MFRSRIRRRSRKTLLALGASALALTVIVPLGAFAAHDVVSLDGSNFEIDVDANLKVDDAPSIDWASVEEERNDDLETGRNDDSYSGGAKEDDTCPSTTFGSIPNNKSDLLTFGAYQETESDGPGFLHLFWSRVNEPSGTTLMDFELNKSNTGCGNGVNNARSVNDLLIEYRIEQGGATANILVRKWTGTAWGAAEDLTLLTPRLAAGTINASAIPFGESDELITSGSISPRTFGELTLDLDFAFEEGKCESFGSAFLKSRASDSFNSQLKDFIKPVNVSISNCGKVVIRKQTNPDEDPNSTDFGFRKSFSTDPATSDTFTLQDDGVETFDKVLFGEDYTVTEEDLPDGWTLDSIDCDASSGVTPVTSVPDARVTFTIDGANDVVDCTFTNRARKGAILITKMRKHAAAGAGDYPHAGVRFTVTGGSLPADGVEVVTDSSGEACLDSLSLSIFVGDYTVTETVPDGYVSDDPEKTVSVTGEADCGDPSEADKVSFENMPLTDITVSVDSQVDGGTASTITCTVNDDTTQETTGLDGDGSLTLSDLRPGTYTCTVVVDP